jgi:hypothetical protein
MDRLVEQLVAWHNSHPLAKRINIYDVHTIGVVALPFMRSGSAAAPAPASNSGLGSARKSARGRPQEPIEPVLTDEISPESLAAWGEESTIAANSNAAELDALADQELWHRSTWPERIKRGLRSMRAPGKRKSRSGPPPGADTWPAFTERFITGLTPERIARFAQRFGYSEQPGDGSWPQRVVPIDEQMMGESPAGGAWPFELYLVSAAIDAGRSRSRVLIGQGHPKPEIIGRRCLSPIKVGLAALLPLGVLLMCVALLMLPSRKAVKDAEQAAATAASAAMSASSSASAATEAATSVAPETGATAASAPTEPAAAASQTAENSSTETAATPGNPALPTPLDLREAAAATAASIAAAQQAALDKAAGKDGGKGSPEASDSAASEPQPDIRPQLVKPIPRKNARPMLADAPAPGSETSASKADDKSSPAKPADPVADLMNGPKPSPVTAGRITSRDGERPSLHSAVEAPAGTSGGSDKRGGARDDVAGGNPTSNSGSGNSSTSRANSGRSSSINKAAVVALVGPVSTNKAEAEATLERMKVAIAATKGGATQAQVFQTPEGWRPAVWPFASREEAQLINATLIARGLRTRAVDF